MIPATYLINIVTHTSRKRKRRKRRWADRLGTREANERRMRIFVIFRVNVLNDIKESMRKRTVGNIDKKYQDDVARALPYHHPSA